MNRGIAMGKDSRIQRYFFSESKDQHTDNTEIFSDETSEMDLFRKAVKDVTPLTTSPRTNHTISNKYASHPESTLKLRRKLASTEARAEDILSDHHVEPVAPEDFISFRHPLVSPALFKSLRTGTLSVEYILDLHGYTVEEARTTLTHFIHFCQKHHYQCVSVIHGKSHKSYARQGITLKSYVARWLTQLPGVRAYASCLPRDGNRGAVYVLLKWYR